MIFIYLMESPDSTPELSFCVLYFATTKLEDISCNTLKDTNRLFSFALSITISAILPKSKKVRVILYVFKIIVANSLTKLS